MYEKRHMWATAHIRGKCFAGFRITSRCEALSQFTTMIERCKRMVVGVVKCGKPQLLRSTLDLVDAHRKLLEMSVVMMHPAM
jgi:hypothetical protein